MSADFDFWNDTSRRVSYDFGDNLGDAVFLPKCPHCGRFVKADESIAANENGIAEEPNATCKRDGRVQMPFDGIHAEKRPYATAIG